MGTITDEAVAAGPDADRGARGRHARTWLRFAAGSIVATVLSQIAFTVTYGVLNAPAAAASVVAFFVGAVPNYLLSRAWAWSDRGTERRHVLLQYLAVIAVTNLLAIGATSLADAWVRSHVASHGTRTLLVDLAYLASYGVMFVLKFLLFDGLVFRPRSARVPAGRTAA